MAALTKNLNPPINGISQQPATMRLEDQCADMVNCNASFVNGISKRPSSEYNFLFDAGVSGNTAKAYVVPDNENAGRYYIYYFENNGGYVANPFRAFYDDGTEFTVSYGPGASSSYFTSGSPEMPINILTLNDYTFAVNPYKTVEMEEYEKNLDKYTNFSGSDYKWTASSTADEWYLELAAGGDPNLLSPNKMKAGSNWDADKGTVGSLASGEWGYGDNDTLGYNTIYVKVIAASDPNAYPYDDEFFKGYYDKYRAIIKFKNTGLNHIFSTVLNGTVFAGSAAIAGDTYPAVNGMVLGINASALGFRAYSLDPAAAPYEDTFIVEGYDLTTFEYKDFDIEVGCRYSNTFATFWKENGVGYYEIDDFADMPTSKYLPDGTTFQIKSDISNEISTPYYAEYKAESNSWTEAIQPGALTTINSNTMPKKIYYSSSDGFIHVENIDWAERKAGSDDTIPIPSFVDSGIKDIFLYQDRLGFITSDTFILSRTDDYFNFFAPSAIDVLDDDPLDSGVGNSSTTAITDLYWAVPFQSSILLFGKYNQYSVNSGTHPALTYKTMTINPTTHYQLLTKAKPVAINQNVYFAIKQGNYAHIMEYFVDPDTLLSSAADITLHAPNLIPSTIDGMVQHQENNSIFFYSSLVNSDSNASTEAETKTECVWEYKYMWEGDRKIQSAWNKIENRFRGVAGGLVIGSTLVTVSRLFSKNNNGIMAVLETNYDEQNLSPTSLGVQEPVKLDLYVGLDSSNLSISYSSPTLSVSFINSGSVMLTFVDYIKFFLVDKRSGLTIESTTPDGKVFNFDLTTNTLGYSSASDFIIGMKFDQKIELSEVFLKNQNKNSLIEASVMLKSVILSMIDSGYVKVEVEDKNRGELIYSSEYDIENERFSQSTAAKSLPAVSERDFISYGDSRSLTIKIVNDSVWELKLRGLTYNIRFNTNKRTI